MRYRAGLLHEFLEWFKSGGARGNEDFGNVGLKLKKHLEFYAPSFCMDKKQCFFHKQHILSNREGRGIRVCQFLFKSMGFGPGSYIFSQNFDQELIKLQNSWFLGTDGKVENCGKL